MKKRNFSKIFAIFILLTLISVTLKETYARKEKEYPENANESVGSLEVHFLDVGQGDATLIIQEDNYMLVDGGDNLHAWKLLSDLMYLGVEHLDYIIATHPDMDHIGGLDVVLEHFTCDTVLMPAYEKDTYSYHEFVSVMEEKNILPTVPNVGDVFQLGTAEFTILAPGEQYEEVNDHSIAFQLIHGENRFLFTGDAQSSSELDMLKEKGCLESEVYKVAHHGSRSSSTELFLLAVNPDYAVISCGEDNDHGHPHSGVLNRLRLLGVEVFRTDEQGTIVAVSDGKEITFNMSPSESWQAGNK